MSSELEARLQAHWDLDVLEAYGAELRAAGDPRGELIAIDLVLERNNTRAMRGALAEERKALQLEWLGPDGEESLTKFGFVTDLRAEPEVAIPMLDAVVPFARTFDLWGDPPNLRVMVEKLASARRPWLASLELRSFGEQTEVTIEPALVARLIEATPNLTRLILDGHLVVDDIPHPRVEYLAWQGHDAIRAPTVMPRVTTVDFTLHPDFFINREPPPAALRGGLVHRSAFPALHTLDVSRNEPRQRSQRPNCFAGKTPILEVLPHIAILPHVTTLRVPSLRSMTHAQQLQAVLDRMPQLEVLEVARMYGDLLGQPRHRSARVIVPPRVAWPAANELRDYDGLVFRVGEAWKRVDVALAYELCETRYATLQPAQQAAWDALWGHVAACGDDATHVESIPSDLLALLFEAIATEEHYGWNELAKELDSVDAPAIDMRRIDGYEREPEPPKPPRVPASSERLDEHERALQASWDLDRLAVYADDLQELGDRRGELIAMDLRLAREPDNDDISFDRDELHQEIFGDEYDVKSQFGLTMLDISSWSSDEDKLPSVFVDEVARYVGSIDLSGPVERVDANLALVLEETRPWLRTVRIETMSATDDTVVEDWSCVPVRWPHLETLELTIEDDTPMFRGFVHPVVHTLRMTGFEGFERLGAPWPSVTSLDLALGRDRGNLDALESLLTRERFPALRTLDLSRNEPRTGTLDRDSRHQGPVRFFDLLRHLDPDLLAQLAHVQLPSLREPAHVDLVRAALERMHALETLAIVRSYPRGPDITLVHPTATITIAPPSPWLPLDRVAARAALVIEKIKLPVESAVIAMEKHHDAMTPGEQAAWREIWQLIEDPKRTRLPASTLYVAVDALLTRDRYAFDWADQLATAIHSRALAENTLAITRSEI